MNLRHHTDDEPSIRRTTAAFEIVTLDDTDDTDPAAADTQPLWLPGTPAADAHVARLIEIGLMTPDVDSEDSEDEQL